MNLESIKGNITLTINDDPDKVISFNPNDVGFVERFYTMVDCVNAKEEECKASIAEIQKDKSLDSLGLPVAARKATALTAEMCRFMRGQIDGLFGAGTSQTVFGDVNVPEMFDEFFVGITPYIRKSRSAAIAKYTKKSSALK